MRMKLWAWAMLGLAPVAVWLGQVTGQTHTDLVYSNQRQQRIPINIKDDRRGDFKEFLLFASWDQGRNWQQVAAIGGDRDAFNFTAPNDGVYWLSVAAVTRQGQQQPASPFDNPPGQKIIIDTLKPLLRVRTLERQGEDVVLAWELQEENPDWTSFRVEYQEKGANSLLWTQAPATAGLTGQARFRPTTSAPINVRVQMRDLAGNQSFAQGEVAGSGTVAAKPPAALDFPGFSNKTTDSHVIPASGSGTPAPPPIKDKEPDPLPPPVAITKEPAPKTIAPPTLSEKGSWTANPPAAPPTLPGDSGKPFENLKPIATTDAAAQIPPALDPSKNIPVQSTRKPLPPLQCVNNPEVTLEYELNRVGPSGVGSVELWWTQNDGQSWELYAIDDKIVGATNNGRHQRTVELPGDGQFGFILVVKSKAGLGKPAPRAGDMPEIRVEVDTAPPTATLWPATPDPSRPNSMLFRWSAKDNNLTPSPITLEWSDKREGPWQLIAANLPNTGKYTWQLPDRAPVAAYIRIRVRDQAGNEGIATTSDPQQLDLSEPEGRLINVTVTPRRP